MRMIYESLISNNEMVMVRSVVLFNFKLQKQYQWNIHIQKHIIILEKKILKNTFLFILKITQVLLLDQRKTNALFQDKSIKQREGLESASNKNVSDDSSNCSLTFFKLSTFLFSVDYFFDNHFELLAVFSLLFQSLLVGTSIMML